MVDNTEKETPSFAVLKAICIAEINLNDSCLVMDELRSVALDKLFNAYGVNNTGALETTRPHQLEYPFPIHLITVKYQEQVKTSVCAKFNVQV